MKIYIEKIKNKEHISYAAFLKKCTKNKITDNILRNIFYINSCLCGVNNKYMLTIKNQDLFDKTFSKFLLEYKDKKVEAALHGNSKTSKNNKSILIWKQNHDDVNSVGIEFCDEKYFLKLNKKKTLTIIENLNNFLDIKSNFDEDFDLDNCNYVWGSGNSITNNNFSSFLNSYDHIICFFDIDLGGFKFYKSLLKQLNTEVTFYFTPYMENRMLEFGKKINQDDYDLLVKNYSQIVELKNILSFIKIHKIFAEQEIFQYK